MAKRLDGKKVAAGLLAAAALYYFGGLLKGVFDDPNSLDDTSGGDESPDTPILNPGDADQAAANQALETPMPQAPAPAQEPAPAPPPQPPVQAPAPAPTAAAQPAPVGPAPGAAPQSGSLALAPEQDGIINKAANWFKNLSPGAQAVLGGGTAGGAAAIMNSLAQKNAMEFSREQSDRAREDKVRRGAIQPFSLDAFRKGA